MIHLSCSQKANKKNNQVCLEMRTKIKIKGRNHQVTTIIEKLSQFQKQTVIFLTQTNKKIS